MAKRTIIRASTLYDGKGKKDDMTIAVEGGRIVDVSPAGKGSADVSGIVTPAFIDGHCHIGMWRQGEPDSESEGNDVTDQIMPLNDPINSIYFDDGAFADSVDFGVLYSCVVPGSGNLVGGRAKVIRNWVGDRRGCELLDYGYKMALGFNPRSTADRYKGVRPNTRMGTCQLLEKRFDDVLAKEERSLLSFERKLADFNRAQAGTGIAKAEREAELDRLSRERALDLSTEDKAILDLLRGGKTAKVHVHKEDDAFYLIQLKERYGFKVTAEHLGDVWHKDVFDELARAGIPVIYGPRGSQAYKVELKNLAWRNAGLLYRSKAVWGLMTDHPVIMQPNLRDCLKYFLIEGMPDYEAIGVITRRNAEILGLGAELGTIEPGKTASLLVWDRDPLSLAAFPRWVMAEGDFVRKPGKR